MQGKGPLIFYSGHGETDRNPEEILADVYLMLSFYDIYFKKTQAPKRLRLLKDKHNENRTLRTPERP